MKNWFTNDLTIPQRTALKAFYGMELNGDELEAWAVFNEACSYDELGRPFNISEFPYSRNYNFHVANLCWGRRSGKTDRFSSTVLAYESLLGGHENFIRRDAKGNAVQPAACFLVAQDMRLARENLPLIRATIETSPLLKKELLPAVGDFLPLKNGINVGVAPASAKALRGYAVPCISMDEVGLWYVDSESANPDFEVERAVKFAQLQFPDYKRIITSTPWVKEGILHKNYSAGTRGWKLVPEKRRAFVSLMALHATTIFMKNPVVAEDALAAEYAADPEAYAREALAQFVDSVSNFLPAALVQDAVMTGKTQLGPNTKTKPYYIAALDPAFRKDAFAFAIVHHDDETGKIVQDVARRWLAPVKQHLSPVDIFNEITPMLKAYNVQMVYSDQYQLEALQQLAMQQGWSIHGIDFTSKSKAKIFGNLAQLFAQRRMAILDEPETISELIRLERKALPGGGVSVAAPVGKHDDMAAVLALAAFKAVWLFRSAPTIKEEDKELTTHEKIMRQLKTAKQNITRELWD